MILSDHTIKEWLSEGKLKISPVDEAQIEPASVDFHISDSFTFVDNRETVITFDSPLTYVSVKKDSFLLMPHSFVLATTKEYFELPDDLTAFVEGRSSVGRMGLFIQNAGWVDPGFKGEITLELFNASDKPILLQAGRRVGQLVFAKLDHTADRPYSGKYQGQKGATGSKSYLDREFAPSTENVIK